MVMNNKVGRLTGCQFLETRSEALQTWKEHVTADNISYSGRALAYSLTDVWSHESAMGTSTIIVSWFDVLCGLVRNSLHNVRLTQFRIVNHCYWDVRQVNHFILGLGMSRNDSIPFIQWFSGRLLLSSGEWLIPLNSPHAHAPCMRVVGGGLEVFNAF